MKNFLLSLPLLLGLQACTSESQLAQAVPECAAGPLLGYVPGKEETSDHRQFQIPVIARPVGVSRDDWEFELTIKIDTAGKPICYSKKDEYRREQALDAERRAVLSKIRNWRYVPFLQNGKPVEAVVAERIPEQVIPKAHVPLPEVPLEQVHIQLARSGCYGSCPVYKVDVYGDGKVVYTGYRYVDVEGVHSYRIPTATVRRLVESIKEKDIWSMQSSFRAHITDNPTYELLIEMGGQKRSIEDYVGQMAGMPSVVTEFEDEVDEASQARAWVTLGMSAVDRLVAEDFSFDSEEGAELLSRAVANPDGVDDAAILKLIELGTPLSEKAVRKRPPPLLLGTPGPVFEEALENGRGSLIAPLIAKGVLETNGRLDADKLNAAFRAAIKSGKLESVRAVWDASNGKVRPVMTFDDDSDEGKRKTSVLFLLKRYEYGEEKWGGMEIAKWLVGKGCDLKAKAADGETLLHVAAEADDLDFVGYLLDHGLNASEPGDNGISALGYTHNEDVAMLLLKAGADPSKLNDDGFNFRRYAEDNYWRRVVEWLSEHHRE